MRKKFMVQKSLFKAINQPKRLSQDPAKPVAPRIRGNDESDRRRDLDDPGLTQIRTFGKDRHETLLASGRQQ
jgi:hypothetical protein